MITRPIAARIEAIRQLRIARVGDDLVAEISFERDFRSLWFHDPPPMLKYADDDVIAANQKLAIEHFHNSRKRKRGTHNGKAVHLHTTDERERSAKRVLQARSGSRDLDPMVQR